eukprot:TCONS_00064097-protein
MEVARSFCMNYIIEKFPTIEHFNDIKSDEVTKDILEYMIKYTQEKKFKDKWTCKEQEFDVLFKYIQQGIESIIKKYYTPELSEYYDKNPNYSKEDPSYKLTFYEQLKDKLVGVLYPTCFRIIPLLLDPEGVLKGRIKPFGHTLLHQVIIQHENQFHQKENFNNEESFKCSCMLIPLLIECGANVNATNYNDHTPLFLAINNLQFSAVRVLLHYGKIDNKQIQLATFFLARLSPKNVDVDDFEKCLQLLQTYGADLKKTDELGNSLLNQYLNAGVINSNVPAKKYLSIVEIIVQNSSNWSTKNKLGFTPLHSCIRSEAHPEKDCILNYLCKQSFLNVNEQDNDLKSPLIHAVSNECCCILLSNGADINLTDKIGLTSLHYASVESSLTLEMFLTYKETDLNAKDCYGDIPIVYAAATGNIETLKKLYPCYKVDDTLYQRLRSVANFNEFPNIVTEIERLKGNDEIGELIPTKKIDLGWDNYQDWLKQQTAAAITKEKAEGTKQSALEQILNLERIRISENQDIKNEVTELLRRMSNVIRRQDDKLTFIPVLSGSNAEGTKVGILDEVDFLCHLEILSTDLQLTLEESDFSPAHVRLRTHNHQSTEYNYLLRKFNKNLYLSAKAVGKQFCNVIAKAITEAEVWDGLHLTWEKSYQKSIATIILVWNGKNYKCKKISIDIVPTLMITHDVHKSSNLEALSKYIDLRSALRQTLLVPKQAKDWYNERGDLLWRFSFSNLETKIFQSLPENVRSGYKIAKFIRDERICPTGANCVISSYILKTCAFHLVLDELTKHGLDSLSKINDREWGINILSKLQWFMETKEHVPHFFLEHATLAKYIYRQIVAFCKIGKGWLDHPWGYTYYTNI